MGLRAEVKDTMLLWGFIKVFSTAKIFLYFFTLLFFPSFDQKCGGENG